ncbi:MAG: response regulator [Pseudomonadota bacterium]
MSILKLLNPLPAAAPALSLNETPGDFTDTLLQAIEDFETLKGRRRLINLTPSDLITLRDWLQSIIADGRRNGASRLTASAEQLDVALMEIEAEAHGYSQRFDLRRLFEGFLDEARRSLAELEADAAGQIVHTQGDQPVVLVIDDEAHVHTLMERAIGREAEVLCAFDCAEALERLDTRRPDLILLDVHLPDMKGTDLLSELKGDKALAQIPVAMLSNSYDDQTVAASLVRGAIDYLSKDIQIASLRPRVMEMLQNGRARLIGNA